MITKITWLMTILFIYACVLTLEYLRLKRLNKINYSNYQNCLMALSEYDPRLAEYLKNRK